MNSPTNVGVVQPVHSLAGKPAPDSLLVSVPKLITAYYAEHPTAAEPAQRVKFGTSGHRGSSLQLSFNEGHVLAITQAICLYRKAHDIDGALFLGWDTHALSEPARVSTLEVLVGNGVEVMVDVHDDVTPTPVISHAILTANRRSAKARADGIVITPSHNPPEFGGLKYDPPTGGPASSRVTDWIEKKANELLENNLRDVRRIPWARARGAANVHRFDYVTSYVDDLRQVVDMDVVSNARLNVGIDPLGGASLRYWDTIAERYNMQLTVVNRTIDPTFRFVTVDRDGAIRMDPSSPYAMTRLIEMRKQFDVAFANDPDADRYGIVTSSAGLIETNHSLAAAIAYLFANRPNWQRNAAVGKTVVTSSLIDRLATRLGKPLQDMPVGFKHFVDGLLDGSVGVAGEESAGASFLRCDGSVWTTDKDGLIMALLAIESTVQTGRDPGEQYAALVNDLGVSFYARADYPATSKQKAALTNVNVGDVAITELAGDSVQSVLTLAPGNQQPIGGVKVVTENGWFAVRPSGTEALYKLYAESFKDPIHLRQIQNEATAITQRISSPFGEPYAG